ncbi:hypothetical protein K439DRAFT_1393826, partial [Ramaria rubella]
MLPLSYHSVVCAAPHVNDDDIEHCWTSLRAIAWYFPRDNLPKPTSHLINLLLEYGLEYHIGIKVRTYYSGIPEMIQISQNYFVESSLVDLLANLMTVAWASATNCARFCNMELSNPD